MLLVFVLQPAQNGNRVFDVRLGHVNRLEAPGERCILLDMLFVFVERGGSDTVQFAARECRLEQIGRIHRAVGFAGADQRVHFIDEENDAAVGRRDFLQHGLQSLFEFAAVFCAGDHRAKIERKQLLVLKALGHVTVDDAQRQPLDDRGLADAGLTDENRVVLGPARENLDRAADLFVAADHRIELAFASRLREIARIFLQRVVGVFGRCGVGGAALCAAH